jgi:hypothetical protein
MKIISTFIVAALSAAPFAAAQDSVAQAKEMADKITAELRSSIQTQTFNFVSGELLRATPVKGAPYSADAVNESTQVLADGNRIVTRSTSTLYRDTEGRERREESIGKIGGWSSASEPVRTVFISDPVAKVSYSLDPRARTAHKNAFIVSAMPQVRAAKVAAAAAPTIAYGYTTSTEHGTARTEVHIEQSGGPGNAPPKIENLGKRVIEGVEAEGTRSTITIPAGQIGNDRAIEIVSERWYSPELQVTMMSRHSDPRTGETVYKLTNVNRSEPLRSMFEVPADYSVVEPKGIVRLRSDGNKDQDQF